MPICCLVVRWRLVFEGKCLSVFSYARASVLPLSRIRGQMSFCVHARNGECLCEVGLRRPGVRGGASQGLHPHPSKPHAQLHRTLSPLAIHYPSGITHLGNNQIYAINFETIDAYRGLYQGTPRASEWGAPRRPIPKQGARMFTRYARWECQISRARVGGSSCASRTTCALLVPESRPLAHALVPQSSLRHLVFFTDSIIFS